MTERVVPLSINRYISSFLRRFVIVAPAIDLKGEIATITRENLGVPYRTTVNGFIRKHPISLIGSGSSASLLATRGTFIDINC